MSGQTHLRSAAVLLAMSVSLLGCGGRQEPPTLLESLAAIEGEYEWRDDLGRYVYSEKDDIEAIITGADPEETVRSLVECLDEASPSASRRQGEPVSAGMLCYEALTQLVYHEPSTPEGDVARDWPGHVTPDASLAELAAAKEAWTAVLREGTYIFL